MKKYVLILLLIVFATGCDTRSPEEKIDNLNGYWEIQTAEMPDGSIKEFPYSQIVDYFVIEGNEGYRKKVQPQLGGSFLTSEDEELLRVKVENDSINLYYTTAFDEWKETLLASKADEIRLKTTSGILYTYKRFTPYSDDYGQEE